MKYYYTEKQYTLLKHNLVILTDKREQKNQHILDWFDKKHILHEERSLESGDYCFKIKADSELGFLKDTYFTEEVFIEKKNSLDELASSIVNETFHYELKRAMNIPYKYLIIEGNCWEDILSHNYNADYNEKSFWNTMHTFMTKHKLKIIFCKKEVTGQMIYSICKSILERNILK